MSEYADLAAQVLLVALADAGRVARTSAACANDTDIAEALAFCTNAKGPWAEAREAWCHVAGVEPDAFVAHARTQLGGGQAVAT